MPAVANRPSPARERGFAWLSLATALAGAAALAEVRAGQEQARLDTVAGRAEHLSRLLEEAFEDPVRVDGNRVRVGEFFFLRSMDPEALLPDWDAGLARTRAVAVVGAFRRSLAELGIDLLLVPVPAKVEVYYPLLDAELEAGLLVSPGRIQLLEALGEEGVEVVDVLPAFLASHAADSGQPIYERVGHHPSPWAVRLGAELVAERLLRYDLTGRDLSRFGEVRRSSVESGDPALVQKVWQVVEADGEVYRHVADAEVVVIGDSNAGIYETASWASHVARAAGVAITDLSTAAGGSEAHRRLAALGLDSLRRRKVVVWIVADTWFLRPGWREATLVPGPTAAALVERGDARGAIAAFRRDRGSLGPDAVQLDQRAAFKLALELLEQGQVEVARELLEITALEYPYSARVELGLAMARLAAGDPESSERHLRRALALRPPEAVQRQILLRARELDLVLNPAPAPEIPLEVLDRLPGRYQFEDGTEGFLRLVEQGLRFHQNFAGRIPLEPITATVFRSADGYRYFTFEVDPESGGVRLEVLGLGERHLGTRE